MESLGLTVERINDWNYGRCNKPLPNCMNHTIEELQATCLAFEAECAEHHTDIGVLSVRNKNYTTFHIQSEVVCEMRQTYTVAHTAVRVLYYTVLRVTSMITWREIL